MALKVSSKGSARIDDFDRGDDTIAELRTWPMLDHRAAAASGGIGTAFDAVVMHIGQRLSTPAPAPVVLVVGRRSGDGATTVAVGVARAFAGCGYPRVLLVTDTERKGVIRRLADRLARRAGGDEAVRASSASADDDGLELMPLSGLDDAGSWRAKHQDGVVVLDAGSLEDRLPYQLRASATFALLVLNVRTTSLPMLRRLKTIADARRFPIDGVVLNRRRFYVPKFLYPLTR